MVWGMEEVVELMNGFLVKFFDLLLKDLCIWVSFLLWMNCKLVL